MLDTAMIDFENTSFTELKAVSQTLFATAIDPLLIRGESILASFQNAHDGVAFTNKRIILLRRFALTGESKTYLTLAYSKIQAFSVETTGAIDLDSQLDLFFSDLVPWHFAFVGRADLSEISRAIAKHIL